MSVITTCRLTKRYGRRLGIDDVSLEIPEGEIFGFLGPNGAGKTTTIRLLLGFLRPSGGRATIFDLDTWHDSPRIKRDIGYLPGDLRLYPWMSVKTALSILSRVRETDLVRPGVDLADRFRLETNLPVRKMSRGRRDHWPSRSGTSVPRVLPIVGGESVIRGLFAKTILETWLATLLFGGGLLLAMALLTHILPQVQEGLNTVFTEMPFVRMLVNALLGADLGNEITSEVMQAILWVHPVVLALVWAHEIVFCTRVPAGEIDRGTIDILLGLPVSRRTVYLSETAIWLLSGVVVLALGLVGHLIRSPGMPAEMRPPMSRIFLVMVNFYCVYIAIGGVTFLVSALSDRRGRAVAIVFAIVLGSFLVNFLARFWEPAEQIAFLSVMQYYQPAGTLRTGQFPSGDAITLLVVGGIAWLLGGEVFARRSICTL